MDIRLLSDHRKDLVAERTRVQNRLRWNLLELCPELERSLGRGSLADPRRLGRVDRRLRRLPACARVRVAREQIAQLRVLARQTDALERELLVLKAHRPPPARRDRLRHIDRSAADRPNRRRRAVCERRELRPPDRHRADPVLLRSARSAPARPRRRPPAQPRPARHRDHPRPPRPGHPGLPGAQGSRRQDEEGSAPLRQTHLARHVHYLLSLPPHTPQEVGEIPARPQLDTTTTTGAAPTRRSA
jgi:hypothetical protein